MWLTSLQFSCTDTRDADGVQQQFTIIQQSFRNWSQFFTSSFLLPVTTDKNLLKITVPSNPPAWPLSWSSCANISFISVKPSPLKPEHARAPSGLPSYAKHHQHSNSGEDWRKRPRFYMCSPVKNWKGNQRPQPHQRPQSQEDVRGAAGQDPQSWHISERCSGRSPPHQKGQVPRPSPVPGRGHSVHPTPATPLRHGQWRKMGFKQIHPFSLSLS